MSFLSTTTKSHFAFCAFIFRFSTLLFFQSFIERLQGPHGNCTSGMNSNFSSTEFLYSRRACLKHCFQSHIEKKCHCVTDIREDKPMCSVLNSTQRTYIHLTTYIKTHHPPPNHPCLLFNLDQNLKCSY